jgi:hypothetical protein
MLASARRPTILIALVLDLWLGGFFAWCARSRIRHPQGGSWAQPSLALVGSFVAIVLAPAGAYLYLSHPAWSWLYLLDPDRVPRLVVVPIVAAVAACVGLGYWGGSRVLCVVADRRALPAALGLVAVLVALFAFIARNRLLTDGSYADFHAGRALPLFEVKLGYVLVAVIVGLAAAAAFVAWELVRDGRKAQTR